MDLTHFKARIESRQQELRSLTASAQSGTETVELDQSKVGRLSRMDAMQIQQMNLESERRRQRELVALNGALTSIEDGSYGDCAECNEPIHPKRLEIDLTAVLCINCASKQESR